MVLPWRDEVSAILAVWFPGQEFGHALADVLSGDVEPGGRLPVSWPGSEADVPVTAVTPMDGRLDYAERIHIGYRAWLREQTAPAFAFGHGLGFTTYTIESVTAPSTACLGEDFTCDVRVANTGDRAGKTVVQLYAERTSASAVERPAAG